MVDTAKVMYHAKANKDILIIFAMYPIIIASLVILTPLNLHAWDVNTWDLCIGLLIDMKILATVLYVRKMIRYFTANPIIFSVANTFAMSTALKKDTIPTPKKVAKLVKK